MASFLVRWRWVILSVALTLTVLAAIVGAGVAHKLAPGGFEVRNGQAIEARAEIQKTFGVGEADVLALVPLHRPITTEPERTRIRALEAQARAVSGVTGVRGPTSVRPAEAARMVSADRKTALLILTLQGNARDKERIFPDLAAALRTADPDVELGGEVAAAVAGQDIAALDLRRAELITVPIAAVLLLMFFRGPVAASLPLIIGAGSIAGSTALLRGLVELTPISLFALNIVTFLGLGLAIDYSLFIVERFREQLAEDRPLVPAISTTLRTAGKTVLYSAAAVAVSLLSLLWVPIPLLWSIAIGGSLIVVTTATMAVVVLPTLLAVLGPRVDLARWDRRRPRPRVSARWEKFANLVMRRPGILAAGIGTALVIIGVPFLRMHASVSDARIFPEGHEVRTVQERMYSPEGFSRNGLASLDVMIHTGPELATSDDARSAVADLARDIAAMPGVIGVDGANTVLAAVPPGVDLSRLPPAAAAALRPWVADKAVLLRVALDREPGTPDANALVDGIEALPAKTSLAGKVAIAAEVDDVLADRLPWALGTIAVTTLGVVLAAFGAIVLAVEAVIINALSLTASFGALVWVFQDGRFEHALAYVSPGSIDPLIPVLMFSIVFGLSMDYQLFLLSRIKQDYDRTKEPTACIARGLAQTAGIITSAASVLIVVLLGFAFGRILFMRELGLGMAIAVALDATIVRALLVPATMALLGRANWWAPSWFTRAWRWSKLGVRD